MIERWLVREGSTRGVGLMRVLLGLITWSRFGEESVLYHAPTWPRVALSLSLFLSSTLMFVGLASRFAALWTGLTVGLMVYGPGDLFGDTHDWTHHHTLLLGISCVLLSLTPCGRSFSVDRLLRDRPERGDLWAVPLIGVQVSVLYASTAWDKSTAAFLSGERLQQIAMFLYFGSEYPPFPGFEALCRAAAIAVCAAEYSLAVGLWIPRFRSFFLVLGLTLHAVFYVLIPVETFSVTMFTLYLAFVDPEAIDRVTRRVA